MWDLMLKNRVVGGKQFQPIEKPKKGELTNQGHGNRQLEFLEFLW